MGKFVFEAVDENGTVTSGTIDARDEGTALQVVSARQLLVTGIKQVKVRRSLGERLKFLRPHVSGEMLLSFTQEIGALINAGITLKSALDGYEEDCEDPVFRQVVVQLSSGLSYGSSLSALMLKYPGIFPRLYVTMIQVGEMTGSLPAILVSLGELLENADLLKSRVKAALFYPATVVTFATIVMMGVLMFGIPRIKKLYSGLGGHLPVPTQIFLAAGDFLSKKWYVILALALLLYWLVRWIFSTPKGAYFLDALKLKLPLFGNIYRRLAIARFSRTLGILYSSGVPIVDSLGLVAESVENRVMGEVVLDLAQHVRKGEGIAENLRQSKIFTNMAIRMIHAGESSGTLGTMLGKLAKFYESQLDIALRALTGLLEPVLMMVIGIAIGVMVIALGLPFLNLMNAI